MSPIHNNARQVAQVGRRAPFTLLKETLSPLLIRMLLSCCLLQSIFATAACINTTHQIVHNPLPRVHEIEEEQGPLFASRRL